MVSFWLLSSSVTRSLFPNPYPVSFLLSFPSSRFLISPTHSLTLPKSHPSFLLCFLQTFLFYCLHTSLSLSFPPFKTFPSITLHPSTCRPNLHPPYLSLLQQFITPPSLSLPPHPTLPRQLAPTLSLPPRPIGPPSPLPYTCPIPLSTTPPSNFPPNLHPHLSLYPYPSLHSVSSLFPTQAFTTVQLQHVYFVVVKQSHEVSKGDVPVGCNFSLVYVAESHHGHLMSEITCRRLCSWVILMATIGRHLHPLITVIRHYKDPGPAVP